MAHPQCARDALPAGFAHQAVHRRAHSPAGRKGPNRPERPLWPLPALLYPKAEADRITSHQLLNHTSGIPGYTELPEFRRSLHEPATPTEFLKTFSQLQLLFEPGTRYSYNNSGYFLLGVILETITGKSYETLLAEQIFSPLSLGQTGYDSTHPRLEKRAAGYDVTLDGVRNTTYLDMGLPYAAGTLYSTVDDLLRWNQALHSGKIPGTGKMFSPGLGDYGYGVHVDKARRSIDHSGGINGFNTHLTHDVATNRDYVPLGNHGSAPLRAMIDGLRAILDGTA